MSQREDNITSARSAQGLFLAPEADQSDPHPDLVKLAGSLEFFAGLAC